MTPKVPLKTFPQQWNPLPNYRVVIQFLHPDHVVKVVGAPSASNDE
jgi:hypothetical protein